MDVLQKKFDYDALTQFEKELDELNKIDLAILGCVKNLKRQSSIVTHKFIIIPVVKEFDLSKIDPDKIRMLAFLLERFGMYKNLLDGMQHKLKLVDEKSGFKKEDERLLRFIRKNLYSLFETMKNLRKSLQLILEIPYVHDKETHAELTKDECDTWKHELTELFNDIKRIKVFCAELEHYSEFLKKRIAQIPFIDAKTVSKKREYIDFFKSNPSLQRQIIETENKIETYPNATRELHGVLKKVPVHGNPHVGYAMHARLGSTGFRIIYAWDNENKHLKYLDIIDHRQMERRDLKYHW